MRRPLGIKLIAALFLLETAMLIGAAVIGYLRPSLRSSANAFIAQRAPIIEALGMGAFGVQLAPLFAIVGAVEGLGIWLLKRWARTFVLWDLVNRLCGGGVAAAMLWAVDRKVLSSIISAPPFILGLLVNLMIVGFLLDPDSKRAFGVKASESEDWLVL